MQFSAMQCDICDAYVFTFYQDTELGDLRTNGVIWFPGP